MRMTYETFCEVLTAALVILPFAISVWSRFWHNCWPKNYRNSPDNLQKDNRGHIPLLQARHNATLQSCPMGCLSNTWYENHAALGSFLSNYPRQFPDAWNWNSSISWTTSTDSFSWLCTADSLRKERNPPALSSTQYFFLSHVVGRFWRVLGIKLRRAFNTSLFTDTSDHIIFHHHHSVAFERWRGLRFTRRLGVL